MAMPSSPCFGCDKRTAGCHGNCIEYAIYKTDMAQYNAVIRDAKDKHWAMIEYDIVHKAKRRH